MQKKFHRHYKMHSRSLKGRTYYGTHDSAIVFKTVPTVDKRGEPTSEVDVTILDKPCRGAIAIPGSDGFKCVACGWVTSLTLKEYLAYAGKSYFYRDRAYRKALRAISREEREALKSDRNYSPKEGTEEEKRYKAFATGKQEQLLI